MSFYFIFSGQCLAESRVAHTFPAEQSQPCQRPWSTHTTAVASTPWTPARPSSCRAPETVAVWRNPMPDIFWRPLRIFSSISIFSLCATCVFSLFFQLKKYYFFFWYHFKSHNVETILASDFFSTKYFFVFFSSRDFVILKANPQPMSKESTITIRHELSNTVQSDPQPRSRLSKLRLRFEIY